MAPTVTVVTPAYKRLEYLKVAIDSALCQTFDDFELLVADDSNCAEIKEYVESIADIRLRYVARTQNLGIALNNWTAFQEATGEYIAKLDDDDAWDSEFLARLVPIIASDVRIGLIFCDHWLIDEFGEVMEKDSLIQSEKYGRGDLSQGITPDPLMVALRGTVPFACASIARAAVLKTVEFDSAIGGAYDRWCPVQIALSGSQFYYVPERLTRYRIHAGSGTATRETQNMEENIYLSRTLAGDPRLERYRRFLLRRECDFIRHYARLCLRNRAYSKFLRVALRYLLLRAMAVKGSSSS